MRALGKPATTGDGEQIVISKERDEALRSLTGGVKVAAFDANRYVEYVKASRLLARDVQIAPGDQALLANGRVITPP